MTVARPDLPRVVEPGAPDRPGERHSAGATRRTAALSSPPPAAGGWVEGMTGMPFPGCVPELTDGVVRLRAHRPDDAERIVEQSTDPESHALDHRAPPLRPRRRPRLPRARSSASGAPRAACRLLGGHGCRGPRRRATSARSTCAPGWRRAPRPASACTPQGRGSGLHGRRAAAGLPLVVRRGRHPGALAGRARQLRLVAGGVVVRLHPPRHHPAVAPRPRRRRGPGPRRVAGQPGRRRRHGAPHAVGGRAGARRGGGARHPAAAVARPRHRARWSRATSPTTTCRPGACSTPTPSPSG